MGGGRRHVPTPLPGLALNLLTTWPRGTNTWPCRRSWPSGAARFEGPLASSRPDHASTHVTVNPASAGWRGPGSQPPASMGGGCTFLPQAGHRLPTHSGSPSTPSHGGSAQSLSLPFGIWGATQGWDGLADSWTTCAWMKCPRRGAVGAAGEGPWVQGASPLKCSRPQGETGVCQDHLPAELIDPRC